MRTGLFQFDQTPGVVPPGSISNSELADMAAHTVKARATNSTGSPEDVPIDTTLVFPSNISIGRAAITGDVTVPQGSNVSAIGAGVVTRAMLSNGVANSVIGRAANTTGAEADIQATVANTVLLYDGSTLSFTTVPAAALVDNSVPLAKLVNATTQFDILGRKTSGAGAWEDCTPLQLKLPQLDAANAFTGANTFSSSTGAALTVNFTTVGGELAVNGDGISGSLIVARYQAAATGPIFGGRKARGSMATPASVVQNDVLSQFNANAYLTNAFQNVGIIRWVIIEPTPGTGAGGTRFDIRLAPVGSITQADAFSIDQTSGGRFLSSTAGLVCGTSATQQGSGTINAQVALYVNANIVADSNGLLRTTAFTVGTLPTASGVKGAVAYVTDALAAPVYNAAAAAGGTVFAKVVSDGTIWRYG